MSDNQSYVDLSGRFDSDLFIGAVKGTKSDFLTIWKQSKILRKLHRLHRKLGGKDKQDLILGLARSPLKISLGYFLARDYMQRRNSIQMREKWKSRLLSILLYLTIRNLLSDNQEIVFIEEGEYDSWIPQITYEINRFTRPFGINVEIKTESKSHPAIVIADCLCRIARSEHKGEVSFNSIVMRNATVIKNIDLDYYVQRVFRL